MLNFLHGSWHFVGSAGKARGGAVQAGILFLLFDDCQYSVLRNEIQHHDNYGACGIFLYFTFGEIVLISRSSRLVIRPQRLYVRMIVISLCFYVAVHKTTYSSLIPYKFFWM